MGAMRFGLVVVPEHSVEAPMVAMIREAIDQVRNHFIFRVQWPGTPQAVALRTIRLFAERVRPLFRGLEGGAA